MLCVIAATGGCLSRGFVCVHECVRVYALHWAEVKDQVHSLSYYWNCNSMITLDHTRAINQIGLTEDEKLY